MTGDAENSGNEADRVTDTFELEARKLEIEIKRSAVRRYVTYGAIGVYLALAFIVVCWLMWAGRHEVAIGVLGGVAALAGSISGFWFGSRRPKFSQREADDES